MKVIEIKEKMYKVKEYYLFGKIYLGHIGRVFGDVDVSK